jgi:hypothetical protein
MVGFPDASLRFQVRFIEAAPSDKPVILIPVIGPVGEVSVPDELKVSDPEAKVVGLPAPPVADAGKVML